MFLLAVPRFISTKIAGIQRISARVLLRFLRHGGHKNLVGPRIRKIRWERKWKQKDLAAKLQILGWDIDRAGVSKIESRLIKVSDYQLLCLMHVLKVDAQELLPAIDPKKPIDEQIRKLMEEEW